MIRDEQKEMAHEVVIRARILAAGGYSGCYNGCAYFMVASPGHSAGLLRSPLNEQTAIVSGTFLFDSQTQTYLDWNFNVSGYTGPVAPLNGMFTPGTSNIVIGGPTFLHLMSPSNQADLVLTFGFFTIGGIVEVPLTDLGGDVPVLISNSPRFLSFFAGANSVVSSVPEPAAGVLMVMGAAILCLSKPGLFRRRARKT